MGPHNSEADSAASAPSCGPDAPAAAHLSRRIVLHGGLATALSQLLGGCAASRSAPEGTERPKLPPLTAMGFASVPVSTMDTVTVPDGYFAQPIAAWGEPIGVAGQMPAFRSDASNTAADQAVQMGMHHDGLEYFPLGPASAGSLHGLLVMNHEYTDDGLLHRGGMDDWSAAKVQKSQAAHGVSVTELRVIQGQWEMVRPSRYARRITAATPIGVSGPAAGHPLLRTEADPEGQRVLGTLNNCACGQTPWGTYLTCEENFIDYFKAPPVIDAHAHRWGLTNAKPWYRWHEHDARFDAGRHPNEPNRFGWVVEIDPMDPTSTPVKRTAMGRAAREGATVVLTRGGHAVVYSGEDARFESIYKFVSRDAMRPGGAAANRDLLDHGTLYVARFHEGGRGEWLPLTHGQGPLTAENGFADQGEVLVKARQAADALGATPMDRPEWVAVDTRTHEVYCSLTNNHLRGKPGRPGIDAANPRADNTMGQIIRWREAGDFDSPSFRWTHFILAGDPRNKRPDAQGRIEGDIFANPDGLSIDARGVMWIRTDMSASSMGHGEHARLGHNMMLAADVGTGQVRRFLTGPAGCEVAGIAMTPDMTTMFVNIQHPGETADERSNPAWPTRVSSWPDGSRPRSATVIVRRRDGGVVGT